MLLFCKTRLHIIRGSGDAIRDEAEVADRRGEVTVHPPEDADHAVPAWPGEIQTIY